MTKEDGFSKRDLTYAIAGGGASLVLLWWLFSSHYVGRYPGVLIANLKADLPYVVVALMGLIAGLRLVSHGWKFGYVPVVLTALFLIGYLYSFFKLMLFARQG